MARNVLTEEVKYFVANRVAGEKGTTLRWLLRVAFSRWSVERCFREAKDELGMDHCQVRDWRPLHPHFFVTQVSHLFCARVRQQYEEPGSEQADRLTVEQVRSAMNTWLSAADLKPAKRKERYEEELKKQRYYQRRSQQSRKSHTEMRLAQLNALGIDANKIKSCVACGLHGDLQRFVHPTYINERSQSGAAQLATVLRCARWQAILLYCL